MMSSWLVKGRPALFETLAAVCDQIDADLATELRERDERQSAVFTEELKRLRVRVAEVDQLEQENRSLREELRTQNNPRKDGYSNGFHEHGRDNPQPRRDEANRRGGRIALGEVSPNKGAARPVERGLHVASTEKNDCAECAKLNKDLGRIASKCSRYESRYEEVVSLLRRKKDEISKWIEYADGLERKIKKMEDRHRSSKDREERVTPAQVDVHQPRHAESTAAADLNDGELPARRSPRLILDANAGTAGSFDGRSPSSGTEALQRRAISVPGSFHFESGDSEAAHQDSTQGDPADNIGEHHELSPISDGSTGTDGVIIKEEPSSDGPEFVSERPVRKRKQRGPEPQETTTRRIKVEDSDSDLIVTGMVFGSQESIDLDERGMELPTPKKKRRTLQLANGDHGADEGWEHHGGDGDASGQPRSDTPQNTEQPRTLQSRNSTANSSALRPLSENMKVQRPIFKSFGQRLKDHRRLDIGIASLAEDGQDPYQSSRGSDSENNAPQSAASARRLNALLNSPSPKGGPVLKRQLRDSEVTPRSDPVHRDVPRPRVLPFEDKRQGNGNLPPKPLNPQQSVTNLGVGRRPGMQTTPASWTPELARETGNRQAEKRLRDLPLASLKLDDFRINPKFNDGRDFAFDEVVRNRSDRESLAGCTDPSCCGKHFGAMARSEFDAQQSVTTGAANIKLLEDYLGEEAYRLGSMSKEEKEKVWLDAKTRELANKYGKHRHRYFRRPSPPGFWNADFPSTQEQQQNRQEADKQETSLIQERYREAMRKGGRWLFRDE